MTQYMTLTKFKRHSHQTTRFINYLAVLQRPEPSFKALEPRGGRPEGCPS